MGHSPGLGMLFLCSYSGSSTSKHVESQGLIFTQFPLQKLKKNPEPNHKWKPEQFPSSLTPSFVFLCADKFIVFGFFSSYSAPRETASPSPPPTFFPITLACEMCMEKVGGGKEALLKCHELDVSILFSFYLNPAPSPTSQKECRESGKEIDLPSFLACFLPSFLLACKFWEKPFSFNCRVHVSRLLVSGLAGG